ncbi:MAG: TRAP transporter solute receptor TAXI family [Beijerinckiaceae bacterium]|nr:MAG: TRAP transporter solute receptor TAXI family [Beijerinckiaceae bacterium]
MRHMLKIIAAVLVVIAAMAASAYVLLAPRVLTVAVGALGGSDLRVTVAFLQALQRERASIRLKLIPTDDAAASARAFVSRKADLAVVRSDVAMPEQAATVAILRRDSVYFIAKPGLKAGKISDLRGKVVGSIAPRPANDVVLNRILSHYGVAASEIDIMRGTQHEVMQAVHEGTLDAVFLVAPASDRMGRNAYQGFPKVEGKEPTILAVSEAQAIVEDYPVFDTVEIVRGAFGGDPPRPDEDMTTLAVTHRLVARRTLDESTVSELTRLLFSLRLSIAAEAPAANDIELPSTEDRGAKLPTHAGTIAYVEGETKTFFERYGDWFYLGIMGFSIVGSVAAAFWSRVVSGGRPPIDVDRELRDLVRLIQATRNAATQVELDAICHEADGVHSDLVEAMVLNQPDADRVATIRFLLDEFKQMQAQKRVEFTSEMAAHKPL